MIEDWQAAGLLKPSVFKPIIFTVEQTLVRKSLGRLGELDQILLSRLLNEILSQKRSD